MYTIKAPSTWYYCTFKGLFGFSPVQCTSKQPDGTCYWGKQPCHAIEHIMIPVEVKPELVTDIEVLLEVYENAVPPMDRHKFAEELIKTCRGVRCKA